MCGRAGRLHTKNAGLRPGQSGTVPCSARCSSSPPPTPARLRTNEISACPPACSLCVPAALSHARQAAFPSGEAAVCVCTHTALKELWPVHTAVPQPDAGQPAGRQRLRVFDDSVAMLRSASAELRLLTQGVRGVPQDPLTPRGEPSCQRAIENAPALVPGPLARL